HQGFDHRQQAMVDVARDVVVALALRVDQPGHRSARDVRYDADHSVTADRQHWQRPAVIPAPHLESLRLAGADKPDLVEVTARFSASLKLGDSPVVPDTTTPSEPSLISITASFSAAS